MQQNNIMFIAEAGMNHDGSFGNAVKMVETAAGCGVDCVKFQLHISREETLADAPMPPYFKGEPRYEYFERTAFTPAQWKELKSACETNGVAFLCSPFSEKAVDILEQTGVEAYKIASGEVTNIPLLEKIGRTLKKVFISSGMSTWKELDLAIDTLRAFHENIVILQCTSAYPAAYAQVGLNVMEEMQSRYGLSTGLSDHTMSPFSAFAAVCKGASVIEKHFTLSRNMYGSDAPHSLEPSELRECVQGIRAIEIMLSTKVDKDTTAGQMAEMKRVFQKSVVARGNIEKGTLLTPDLLAVKKPGTGIPAARLKEFIGKKTRRQVCANTLIRWEDIHA